MMIEVTQVQKRFMLQASGEPDAAEEGAGTGQKGSRPAFRDPETVRQLEHLQPGCCILSLRCGLHGAWAGSAIDCAVRIVHSQPGLEGLGPFRVYNIIVPRLCCV